MRLKLFDCLAGELAGQLAGWLAGWLAGGLAGLRCEAGWLAMAKSLDYKLAAWLII